MDKNWKHGKHDEDYYVYFSKKDLEELFALQLSKYEHAGVKDCHMQLLRNKRQDVILTARGICYERGQIPFLPVFARQLLSLRDQCLLINPHAVNCVLQDSKFDKHYGHFSESAFYIFGVEDGSAVRGRSGKNARCFLSSIDRFSCNIEMGLSLAFHTQVLQKHNLDLVANVYDYDAVPTLCTIGKKFTNKMLLCSYTYEENIDDAWGAPSYSMLML